jgi:hypothetical protein
MPQFSTSSLFGICGFTVAANDVQASDPHFLPIPVVGTLNFNGSGDVSLTATQNSAGTVKTLSESGTYLVNPDGLTGTIDFSGAGGAVLSFVIVAGGHELRFINTGKTNPATGLLDQVLVGQCDF